MRNERIVMETKKNEENDVLRERFELAMERIGEIAGEATVPEIYQPYFRRTAGFILTMEGLYGEIRNGHTENYTLKEWQTLNRSLYLDILPALNFFLRYIGQRSTMGNCRDSASFWSRWQKS